MDPQAADDADRLRRRLSEVCASLGAVAAGYWERAATADRLDQVAFVAGPTLDPEVGRAFAEATWQVPLIQTSLGIVAAALGGQSVVSDVFEVPADVGSGRWLLAFGARRSVAVPVRDRSGLVRGVVSIALPADRDEPASLVAERLLDALATETGRPGRPDRQ